MVLGMPLTREVERPMRRTVLPMLIVATSLTLRSQDPNPASTQPGPVGAQTVAQPDGQYETGRAVARISVLNGDVSVRRGDSGDVVAAAVNAPLMADDRILTGSSSRAEVQLDYANVIRISPNSEVRFSGMDIRNFQMQVAAGTVTFRVLRQGQAQAEVDTPSVAVHPLGPGVYRVSVKEDGSSEITVRAGQAQIFSSNGSEQLQAGQTMNARGSGPDTEFQIVQAVAPDSWDRWNEERDGFLLRSQSYQHVSPDVYGAEDLDQNGRWVNDPTYGSVWAPNEPAGWAPYQDGRWAWEDYYGWTWISYDPWGWAPYHYGRWFSGPFGWCWYPGPVYARAYWSPALVGFFGWGGGLGVGVGFGFAGIGWVPLAPFEVFHPWWGRGFYGGFRAGAFGGTSIVNNVNVYNTFRNARVNGAVTGVNTADFGRRAQFTSLNRTQLQSAGLVRGALPVAPDRSSLRMSDRAATGNFSQSRAQSFTSHMQTARVDHVSFDQQQRGMQQMSHSNFSQGASGAGNSFSRTMPNTGNRTAGTTGGNSRFGGNNSASATHGWDRFGEPIHGTSSTTSQAQGGWQRFPGAQNANSGSRSAFAGGGQPVHISPSIVQQRAPSYSGAQGYQGSRGSYEAPRSSGSGGGSAPRSYGGGSARPSGGGGHAGGGHNGGHR